MRRERLTDGEILSAVRQHGLASLDDVEAIVLKTDGTLACIGRLNGRSPSADQSTLDQLNEKSHT
jgi:uncharacterized membrane protein YcaP (DUF421 family)